jgi:DNA-binding NarL/FixJ family response regulator
MKKVRLAMLCREPLVRSGIEHFLSGSDDIDLGLLDCPRWETLSFLEKSMPDVVIVDIDDFEGDRFRIVREIKHLLPSIGVIVVANTDGDDEVFQTLKSHASAILNKRVTRGELLFAVRRVSRGEYPINDAMTNRPGVAGEVIHQFQKLMGHRELGDMISPLTPREKEVLDCLVEGCSNRQTASKLGISDQTIKVHITSIMRKLNANSRTEAVVTAIKRDLVSID